MGKRYDDYPYVVGEQESSQNPNNYQEPNFYTSQGTGLYSTPLYAGMSPQAGQGAQGAQGGQGAQEEDGGAEGVGALVSGLGTIGMGAYQSVKAGKALKELNKKGVPNYAISPEMQKGYETSIARANLAADAAKSRAKYGFNTAQKAQYEQNLARQNNTAYQNALSRSGGNLSKAINAAIGSQNISGQNQFAVSDATLQDRKINEADLSQRYASQMGVNAGSAYQSQRNLMSQQDILRRMELERALGLAKSQGMTNIASGVNSLGTGISAGMKLAE